MSEDDPVLLPSKPRRLVVEFRSWPRLCEKGFVSAPILSRRRFCDYGTPICAESTL